MKKLVLPILFLIILSAVASAQILVSVDEQTTCGDGIREGHEMCEPETDQDLCEEAGKVLGIVMVCDERDCTCLPKRMDCGNEIREGVEYCDPGEKEDKEANDFCDELGAIFNETFTCDESSCLCAPETAYGAPAKAICGDGNITGIEECEKDDDCRADQKCENCTCVLKERIDVEEELKKIEENTSIKKPVKKEEKEFDYHDLEGVILPAFLQDDFDEANVNVYIKLKNGSSQLVGVKTLHSVVQEIVDGKMDNANFDAFVDKEKAQEIIDSSDRTAALKTAFDEGDITYKPKGLFSRIWHWFTGLFR